MGPGWWFGKRGVGWPGQLFAHLCTQSSELEAAQCPCRLSVGEQWSILQGGGAGLCGDVRWTLKPRCSLEEASQRGPRSVGVQEDSVPSKQTHGGSGARLGWGGGGEQGGGWPLAGRRRCLQSVLLLGRRSGVSGSAAPWAVARHTPLFTVSWSSFKLVSIESVTPSNHPVPFSSCLQSFPASGSFPVSRLFASGGQSIGASASVLPMNIQGPLPLGWTGWISWQSRGLSRAFSNTTVEKHQFFGAQLLWSDSHVANILKLLNCSH